MSLNETKAAPAPILAAVLWAALIVVALAGPAAAQGPSFDCAMAGTNIELAICSNNQLASLDHQLAQAYRVALANSSTRTA